MHEIKLQKRYKYAGDIAKELVERAGWNIEDVIEFLNSIKDADVTTREDTKEIFSEIEKIIQDQYNKATINEQDEELEVATDYLTYVACEVATLRKKYGV